MSCPGRIAAAGSAYTKFSHVVLTAIDVSTNAFFYVCLRLFSDWNCSINLVLVNLKTFYLRCNCYTLKGVANTLRNALNE